MLPNLSGLPLAAGGGGPAAPVATGGKVAEMVQKGKEAIFSKFKSQFNLDKIMSLENAKKETLRICQQIHESLAKRNLTKRSWEEAEAVLRRMMMTKKPKNVKASLGDTVLTTGTDCDDEQYARQNPKACESIAEGVVWQVIWCFVMYLLDTNPEMNHVGCAGFA